MSYILEALKKAEQSRLGINLPNISSVTHPSEEPGGNETVWFYGATSAAVIACAALLGWYFASKPQDKPVLEKVAAVSPHRDYQAAREPAGISIDLSQGGEPIRDHISLHPHAVASSASLRAVPPADNSKFVVSGEKVIEHKLYGLSKEVESVATHNVNLLALKDKVRALGSSGPALEKLPLPGSAEAPLTGLHVSKQLQVKPMPGARVWRLDELPQEIRRDLPKFGITGYVYSAEAAGRVVSINERSLREGDELAAGLKLELIATDYLLFSFRGYRFRSDFF